MLRAGLMTITATGWVLALRCTVAVRFVASCVRRDAATVCKFAAAAIVRVSFATAVAAPFVDHGRLTLVTPLADVLDMTLRAVVVFVLAAARALLARTRRPFQRVALSRRPRSTLTTAHWPKTSVYTLILLRSDVHTRGQEKHKSHFLWQCCANTYRVMTSEIQRPDLQKKILGKILRLA